MAMLMLGVLFGLLFFAGALGLIASIGWVLTELEGGPHG